MGDNKKTRGVFRTGMLLLLLSLSSAALLLGCESDGIETIAETANELEETHGQTVEELNLLLQEEAELQTDFEETLETDDDLSTFGDGTSPVFRNLSDRKERMERLVELEEEYARHAETLRGYNGSLLDENALDSLAADLVQFFETLGIFRGEYVQNLEEKETYFEGLAAEDATYDIFTEGIHSLNAQHEIMREHFYGLDEELSVLSQGIEELQQTIQEIQEEEE
ncbi:YkyA family protein [Isachenkonia alkalipeptolytica]|uniref:Cell-wall binding lipoprotein n=1 Tax=Isachenkonia alkalipeptolytica TaxID=2565777 RepID=A0AA44BDB8_9CLOT|nr:YkyA family protein [Isachenkonia alkalipeptolytica]NBG88154.1 hypothetical protein [Isachenkonia alkalipeptolytica]